MRKTSMMTPSSLEYEWLNSKQDTTQDLIEELEAIILNLKTFWDCECFKIEKKDLTSSHNKIGINYTLNFKLIPAKKGA